MKGLAWTRFYTAKEKEIRKVSQDAIKNLKGITCKLEARKTDNDFTH